jgi:hypothetical protein
MGSPVIQAQVAQRSGFREPGEFVDQVWASLFRGFVRQFDHHVVIDRFAVPRLARRDVGTSGIECYLKRLSTGGGGAKYVEIISTIDTGQTEAQVKRRLSDFVNTLPAGRFKGVDLICVFERDFQPLVHYRLVRFNKVHCLRLDKGIEILEGLRLNTTHSYGLENYEGVTTRNETTLRAKSFRRIPVFVHAATPARAAAVGVAQPSAFPRSQIRPVPGRARI